MKTIDPILQAMMVVAVGPARPPSELVKSAQAQACCTRQVPVQGSEALAELGFVLGEADREDPLFRQATWPEGWSQRPSNHQMWSYIVDSKGRQRVRVFYEGGSRCSPPTFWDRDAFLSAPMCRFNYTGESTDPGTHDFDAPYFRPCILDGGFEYEARKHYLPGLWNKLDAAQRAHAWLDEHRPGWQGLLAYWDDAAADLVALEASTCNS